MDDDRTTIVSPLQTAPARTNRHIPVLDGLRGIAILAVIVCHVNWAYGGPFVAGRISGPLSAAFGWGWVGVELFFVLSGFLITGILYDAKGCENYFRIFYARRILRIMPLYFGFLVLVIALPRLGCRFCPWLTVTDAIYLGTYTYNFRLVFTQSPLAGLHHFWSLAVEEQYYFFWPLFVWSLKRRPLMRLCLYMAIASPMLRALIVSSGVWPLSAFFLTPCRLDGILAGSYIALASRCQNDWAMLQRQAGVFFLGGGCLLLGMALGQRHFLPDVEPNRDAGVMDATLVLTLGLAVLAWFFSGLLVMALDAAEGSRIRWILNTRALCTLGKYSYAMYVFHPLILQATSHFFPAHSGAPAFVSKPLALIWAVTVSFVAAWLSYHFFEKHFLELKRYFGYRESSNPVSQSSPPIPPYDNAESEPQIAGRFDRSNALSGSSL